MAGHGDTLREFREPMSTTDVEVFEDGVVTEALGR
jgi:hypothetical protein